MVFRIQCRVAEKFVDPAVKLVAAGLQNNVHHRSALANVRAKIIGLNFKLFNRIHGWLDHLEPNLLLVVIESIQKEVVVGRRQAVDLNRAIAALIFRNTALLHNPLRPTVHTGREIRKLNKIPAVQRQVVDSILLDHLPER